MVKKYRKEIILGVFIIAIIGMSVVQYQYARIGISVAKVQFQNHLSTAFDHLKTELSVENELTFLLLSALREDNTYFNTTVDSIQSASSGILHDFLLDRMLGEGIQAEFGYEMWIADEEGAKLSYFPVNSNDDKRLHTMKLDGYLPQSIEKDVTLKFYFYELDSYLRQKLNGIIIPSILFMVLITLITIWVFYRTYYQNWLITTTNSFINNLIHELKTPVFSIGIASKLLKEDPGLTNHAALEHIDVQNNRLKEHIEKVLQLAEMEENGYVMKLERLNLAPMMESLRKEYELKSEVEGFPFKIDYPSQIQVKADESNFKNALINLLENAIKYGEGSEVQLMVTEEEKEYFFRVRDQGPGIPGNQENEIFKKFYRISEGNLHYQNGYGLGLHYVKLVVEYHRGKILVENADGRGALFTVILPKVS